MMINKKISIINNDAYEIGHTKNFIVINDNYSGINLYDCKLKHIKTLKFPRKVYIYQMYTSILNDYVVVLDTENTMIYIVDLANKKSTIIEKKCEKIFFSYYKTSQNNFWLTDSNYLYNFSYEDVTLIQKIPSNGENEILARYENELIFLDGFKNAIYCKGNIKKIISKNYRGDCWFSLCNEKIIKYTEETVFVYECEDEIRLIDSMTTEEKSSISGLCCNKNKIFVLTHLKENIKCGVISEYGLS